MSEPALADEHPHPGTVKVMMQLMKLRVIVLLQITALCAILIHDTFARYGVMDLERTWSQTFWVSFITVVGGTLSAGGSNAINMWYDADIDPHMRRTMNRPIPLGHATPQFALVFGSLIAIIGSSLFLLVSVKAAFWSAFSVLFYVLVYSMWLKRRTPQNIVIGGIAGSTPPLIGWAAAAGDSIANANMLDLGSAVPWMLFFLI
ncbi:MAG: protoheme IX farnesyltransferase, partial [Poseidonia sp.]